MENLYDNSYLKKTTEFIKYIKEESYKVLSPVKGASLLEVGCGNGYDSIELAKIVGVEGKVVGIDVDDELIIQAKYNASAANVTNVDFIVSNAETLPFEDNAFDGVRTERVFQHLKKPDIVIKEMHRVLKPGAKILLVETDWCGMNIYINDRLIGKKIIDTLVTKVLNNGYASREILGYLRTIGANNIGMAVYPVVITDYAVANGLIKFDNIINVARENNLINDQEVKQWHSDIELLTKNKSFYITTNMLFFWGNK